MKLEGDERVFLAAEATALAAQLDDPEARGRFELLAAEAELGEVADEAAAGTVASLAVETGRARSAHGPAGVRSLTALWKRTPQGAKAGAEAGELNEALRALRGQPVEAIRVSAIGPGVRSISIAAGDFEVRLVADGSGIALKSLNVGGGGYGE
jgi:hypothetical protein